MAITKIISKGAIVTIAPHSDTTKTETVECIRGDYEIDLGTFDTSDEVCHEQGSYSAKDTSAKYGEISWKLYLDSDKTNSFQKMLEDAHYNQGDFADPDNLLHVKVEFSDPNTNVYEFNAFVVSRKLNVILTKYVDLDIVLKQFDKPVRS